MHPILATACAVLSKDKGERGRRDVPVYARDGKVLRTNHSPMDRQAMGRYEEAAFVRDR